MNIFNATFTTGQVLEVVGVSHHTFQGWLTRNLVIGQKDIGGGGSKGRHRQFSFCNVMEIAVAKALIDEGLTDLTAVFRAANSFAHSGGYRPDQPKRDPSCPFDMDGGITLIVAHKNWSDEVFLSFNESAVKFYTDVFNDHLGSSGAFILNANKVFDHTVARLGYHPEQVLEMAYNKSSLKGQCD